MHYLEDFVDSMEQLPKLLREKFSHLLDLDISVQSDLERLDRQGEQFFTTAESVSQDDRDRMMRMIRKEYCASMALAGQKVQLAEEMCRMVRLRLVSLDEELVKYQADLEADHPGVTAVLQERSLMLDLHEFGAKKDRRSRSSSLKKHSKNVKRRAEEGGADQSRYLEAPRGQFSPGAAAVPQQQVLPGLEASRARAAVQVAGGGRGPVAAHQRLVRRKKPLRSRRGGVPGTAEGQQPVVQGPHEPTYCSCNQVSYGDMVACDNERCLIEWFHYSCVGIETPPQGRWYCPQCTASKLA